VSGRNKGAGFYRTESDHVMTEKKRNIGCLKSDLSISCTLYSSSFVDRESLS
jgi:hypothetical protein